MFDCRMEALRIGNEAVVFLLEPTFLLLFEVFVVVVVEAALVDAKIPVEEEEEELLLFFTFFVAGGLITGNLFSSFVFVGFGNFLFRFMELEEASPLSSFFSKFLNLVLIAFSVLPFKLLPIKAQRLPNSF